MKSPTRNCCVVIATYNEIENIEALLEQLLALDPPVSALVVDDHSPDGTARQVQSRFGKEPRIHLLEREGKLGYGTAMVAGFQWATFLLTSHDY